MSRPSLARRLPLAMAGVAALAMLIAALVAWPLFIRAAESTARATLSRTADLTAELLQRTSGAGFPRGGVNQRLQDLLATQQVTAYWVFEGAEPVEPFTDDDVEAVTTGEEVSARRASLSGASFVEGRPVSDGVGVLLVQPSEVARDLAQPAIARLVAALALGLTVAAAVGYLIARRITRPLGAAAAAANAMSSGRRDSWPPSPWA